MPTTPDQRWRPKQSCSPWRKNSTVPSPARRAACTRRSPCCASVCRRPFARTLRSTNAIESMISVCRDHAANVKRWRDGQMALRWCAAGMVEASRQFRRVNGHFHLPALRSALAREVGTDRVTNTCDDQEMNAA